MSSNSPRRLAGVYASSHRSMMGLDNWYNSTSATDTGHWNIFNWETEQTTWAHHLWDLTLNAEHYDSTKQQNVGVWEHFNPNHPFCVTDVLLSRDMPLLRVWIAATMLGGAWHSDVGTDITQILVLLDYIVLISLAVVKTEIITIYISLCDTGEWDHITLIYLIRDSVCSPNAKRGGCGSADIRVWESLCADESHSCWWAELAGE